MNLPLFLDTSALLRYAFQQPGYLSLPELSDRWLGSSLLNVETARTLDRLRYHRGAAAKIKPESRRVLGDLLQSIEMIEVTQAIFWRASAPMPGPLGTLDALHLSAALVWRELNGEELLFATHDKELGRVAQMHHLKVVGVSDLG